MGSGEKNLNTYLKDYFLSFGLNTYLLDIMYTSFIFITINKYKWLHNFVEIFKFCISWKNSRFDILECQCLNLEFISVSYDIYFKSVCANMHSLICQAYF